MIQQDHQNKDLRQWIVVFLYDFQRSLQISLIKMIKRSILGLGRIIINTIKIEMFSFSTVSQKLVDLKQKQKYHRQTVINKQQFQSYFTNQYLFKLVEEGYCFSDLVNITNNLISYYTQKSDTQIMFMVYSYNLYYNQLKQGKVIIEDLNRLIMHKIEKNEYQFQSPALENILFSNIKTLANRDNKFLEQQLGVLKQQFFYLLCLKNGLINDQKQFKKVNKDSLDNLFDICPYFPKQIVGQSFLKKLERFYFDIVDYQCHDFLSKSDDQVHKQQIKQSIDRFIVLMEQGIIIGKFYGKYLSILQHLPTQFQTEQKFINFMKIMKEIFTFQFLKRIDYKQFDVFNQQLSRNNYNYKSQAAIKAFEQYTQILMVHQYNNLKVFDHFYEEQKVNEVQMEQK